MSDIIKMPLAELCKMLGVTQCRLAARLGISQDVVSRTERRGNVKPSTLRTYARGLGGELRVVIVFPHRASVEVIGHGSPDEA